jgi:hypothetical protein
MIISDYDSFFFADSDEATERHPINYCKVATDAQQEPALLQTAVVFIKPPIALQMLRFNCKNNRAINKSHVASLVSEMKSGKFKVSDSAICFSSTGEVTNGQHRLSAIVDSNLGQWCLVMLNTDKEQGLRFDLGKSRSMSDRITFNGTRITIQQCAAVRHAMADISKPTVGTMQFGKAKHDPIVEQHFLKFKDFFDYLRDVKDSTNCKGLLTGCGLKIYAQMKNQQFDDHKHGMNAEQRVLHWMQITHFGHAKTFPYQDCYDKAAFQIYKHIEDLKLQNLSFADFNSLRMAVNAAYKFMNGDTRRVRNEHKMDKQLSFNKDPFTRLQDLTATNPEYGNS